MDQCLSQTAGARPQWIVRAAQAIVEAAAEIRTGLSRAAMNRRVLHRLSTLSERELKDIGLSRQDVADACGPGVSDAVGLLNGRREERRSARGSTWRW
ncbi:MULTISPECIES: DUF1127 domain-containing protein [unclassified Methylobacterium]|jgi:uncharacterized protein YjiS (DUF1127 family)|uniref:DUF1127 domain-containing protein n=1 Tax=unclassified Methylobacterium TaxID=2615210 RepID=UPI0013535ED7|nr:DUF1127 domain-containing protein [Methylobacterium sp. 2A]MWV25377.1 DUF1127 domain-containing protein [Methylobacterium sp. 2A]